MRINTKGTTEKYTLKVNKFDLSISPLVLSFLFSYLNLIKARLAIRGPSPLKNYRQHCMCSCSKTKFRSTPTAL